MPTAANNDLLVLTGFSSFNELAEPPEVGQRRGLYQLLVEADRRKESFRHLADTLVALAEHAYGFRQTGTLAHLSQILVNLPLPRQYEGIGLYYQALSVQRSGSGNLEQAATLLERTVASSTSLYRLKALQSLSVNFIYRNDHQSALKLYKEGARLALGHEVRGIAPMVALQSNLAVLRSLDGNHSDALELLDGLFPLARTLSASQPHIYCAYMNSLAVELGEAGRLDEAERASRIALASPLAIAYPEWHDTKRELELRRGLRASRSHIAVGQPLPVAENPVLNNVVRLQSFRYGVGMTAGSSHGLLPREEARILRFRCRKETMAKQSRNTNIAEQIRQMSHAERVIRLLELISSNDTTPDELAKILEIAESVAGKGKKQG